MEKVNKLQELNKKLILEVKMLRVENGTLKKTNGKVSNKRKEFEEQIERLEAKKSTILKELENLARVSKEFEDEIGRKSRTMQMEVVQKANALEEIKGALSKKEEALKIAQMKECEFIAQLDKVKNEVEVLQVKQIQQPQSHSSKGSSSNSNLICYVCSRREHFKAKNYKFNQHRKMKGPRNMWSPPRVKQIWVRKDQVHLFRNMGKEKIVKSPNFVWVAKKREFPNLVKPPLEESSLSLNASH